MSKNRKYIQGSPLKLPVPSGTVSGTPVAVGPVARPIAGVALTDRDANGEAVCDCGGVYNLSVKAENGSGNSKVEVGDLLYLAEAKLTKIATGSVFGSATEVITSGSTAVIGVRVGF